MEIEVDSGSECSSDDEQQILEDQYIHTGCVNFCMENEEMAETICKVLSVDKEPNRSGAVREITTCGKLIQIKIKSKDMKSLSKSIANAVDMCELSKNTINMCKNLGKSSQNGKKRPFPEETGSNC